MTAFKNLFSMVGILNRNPSRARDPIKRVRVLPLGSILIGIICFSISVPAFGGKVLNEVPRVVDVPKAEWLDILQAWAERR